MDLNRLLYHHQLAMLRASPTHGEGRSEAFDLARHYKTRIDRLRQQMGVAVYPEWCAMPADTLA